MIGAFSFGWIMDSGVGLVIGYAPSVEPAQFTYQYDKNGKCPMYNEGYRVDAEHAKAMAMAAVGLVTTQKYIRNEWDRMSPEEREEKERGNKEWRHLYREPVRDDFIEEAKKFAEFAWESGGFTIW
jgi:hypothetical protein